MNPARRQALKPYLRELKCGFTEAAATAITPGKQRTWFVTFLQLALSIYGVLATKIVEGRPLSRALAKDPRRAFLKLLKSSRRDAKTMSRWAAVLVHAWQSNVRPEDLPTWLEQGGGAAGRAAELAAKSRSAKAGTLLPSTPIQGPSSQPDSSPEAKAKSPQ
jgi:hypothetical protein